jgi:hypothetical protein
VWAEMGQGVNLCYCIIVHLVQYEVTTSILVHRVVLPTNKVLTFDVTNVLGPV